MIVRAVAGYVVARALLCALAWRARLGRWITKPQLDEALREQDSKQHQDS